MRRTGRGRKRIVARKQCYRREAHGHSQGERWFANCRGVRQHKNHADDDRRTGLVATSHGTVDNSLVAVMLAVYRRFPGCYLPCPWHGLICFRVSMRRAHAALAAGHSVRVPRLRPHGRPEQDHPNKTHHCPEPSSRSDGNVQRMSHGLVPASITTGTVTRNPKLSRTFALTKGPLRVAVYRTLTAFVIAPQQAWLERPPPGGYVQNAQTAEVPG